MKFNKIKLALFTNPVTIWLLKILRYVVGIMLCWKIWKAKSFPFHNQSPWQVTKIISSWSDYTAGTVLSAFLALAFFVSIIVVYLYLSKELNKWLTHLEISPQEQVRIFQKKVYFVDEKNNYPVKNIENLKITSYRNSQYASFQGVLILETKFGNKKVNFICHSYFSIWQSFLDANNLETYFSHTNLQFREKAFFTWQKILLSSLGIITVYYIYSTFQTGLKSYPNDKLINVLDGQAASQAKELDEKKQKEAAEKERRKVVMNAKNIRVGGWEDIGGLKDAKEQMRINTEIIKALRKGQDTFTAKPKHAILFGPPGTGKSTLIKTAIKAAAEEKDDLLYLFAEGRDFASRKADLEGVGSTSEDKIKAFFNMALKEAGDKTIIVFLEEIDGMGGMGYRKAGYQLLNILDEIDPDKVIILATTNHIESLEPALIRSERIGELIPVSFPSEPELKEIIETCFKSYYAKNYSKNPQAFGNQNQDSFVKKWSEFLTKEMSQDKYKAKLTEIGVDEEKLKEEGREEETMNLFVGADVKTVISDAFFILYGKKQTTYEQKSFEEALKKAIQRKMQQMMSGSSIWGEGIIEYIRARYKQEITANDLFSYQRKKKKL